MEKVKLYRAPEKIQHDCRGCFFERSEVMCPEDCGTDSILIEECDQCFEFEVERKDGSVVNYKRVVD